MNVLHPNGMVERMGERYRKPGTTGGYGRRKDGNPNDSRTLKIAKDSDRRRESRRDDDPLRGRLFDLSA
ncbi:MAG: hypothetical protein AAF543_09535 [Pseudomonadota bacterium]